MIDRKTLGIVLLFLLLMLVPAAWRVMLLDNWTSLPRYNRSGDAIRPIHSLILLAQPAALLFVYASFSLPMLLGRGPQEKFAPYRARSAFGMAGVGLVLLAAQILIITRSLGGAALELDPALFMRFGLVFAGLITIVISNRTPKLPVLNARIRLLDFDPETGAKMLRLNGYHGVATGCALIAVALLLPDGLRGKAILGLCILSTLCALSIFVWAQVKRMQASRTANQ